MSRILFTIGHSTHSLSQFCELLKGHQVTAVADVRSVPYSRRNPEFNREALQANLEERGIAYSFLGVELGGRPSSPDCYLDGRVQYDRLAETHLFRTGLECVHLGAERYRLALLCAEADPIQCHRTILVCRRLKSTGLTIQHILPTGMLESQDESEKRLLRLNNLSCDDLFSRADEVLEEAYRLQESRIAYTQLRGPERRSST
jgi:uncharacterized protein (DUF488 family)